MFCALLAEFCALPASVAASAIVPSCTDVQVRLVAQYQGLFLFPVSYQMSPKSRSWVVSPVAHGAAPR